MTDHNIQQESTGNKRLAIALNKMTLYFARTWSIFLAVLVFIYVGLPFVAPVAMKAGATKTASVIYTIYKPMCHQYAFRSWFLFGEQAAYPRERSDIESYKTFEEYASIEPYFDSVNDLKTLDGDLMFAARGFNGSERMGYKVALCQRDVAIYMTLALFGLLFFVLHRLGIKVPYLPIWAYFLIAIVPIGLDGFSQLFANPPFNGFGFDLYPIRESTPFLRTLTGALFGLGNGWLALPYIEESMSDTRELIETKFKKAGIKI